MRIMTGGCYTDQPANNTTCGTTGGIVSDYTIEIECPVIPTGITSSINKTEVCVNEKFILDISSPSLPLGLKYHGNQLRHQADHGQI